MQMETKMKKITYPVVALVPSDSNPTRSYKVSRTPKGLICSCMAFRFTHGEIGSSSKSCKHLARIAS